MPRFGRTDGTREISRWQSTIWKRSFEHSSRRLAARLYPSSLRRYQSSTRNPLLARWRPGSAHTRALRARPDFAGRPSQLVLAASLSDATATGAARSAPAQSPSRSATALARRASGRERDAHDGHGEQDRCDEVAKRQPPSGEKQPHDVADHPQRAGADVFAAEIFVTRYGLVAERQQRVDGDAEPALAQGKPTMVIAMTTAAITQPSAIHKPPKTWLRNRRMSASGAAFTIDSRSTPARTWAERSRPT
jgi:hypothetical protein